MGAKQIFCCWVLYIERFYIHWEVLNTLSANMDNNRPPSYGHISHVPIPRLAHHNARSRPNDLVVVDQVVVNDNRLGAKQIYSFLLLIPTDCVRVRTQISAVRSCLEIFPDPPLPAWPQKSVGPSPRALPYQLPRADPPLVFSRLWPDTALLFRNRIGNEIQQTIPGYPLISQVFSIDSNWTSLGFHHIEPAETSDNPSPPGSPPCPFSALPGTSSPTFPPT